MDYNISRLRLPDYVNTCSVRRTLRNSAAMTASDPKRTLGTLPRHQLYCLERVFDPDALGPFDIRLACPLPERPRNAAKAR